jgi:hypothetical protein
LKKRKQMMKNAAENFYQTIDNLQQEALKLEEVLADAGYSSGRALRYLHFQNNTGYIPNFGQYKPMREGFIYEA